jgi:hypothetical protein
VIREICWVVGRKGTLFVGDRKFGTICWVGLFERSTGAVEALVQLQPTIHLDPCYGDVGDEFGVTKVDAMSLAAWHGRKEIVERLLHHGASPFSVSKFAGFDTVVPLEIALVYHYLHLGGLVNEFGAKADSPPTILGALKDSIGPNTALFQNCLYLPKISPDDTSPHAKILIMFEECIHKQPNARLNSELVAGNVPNEGAKQMARRSGKLGAAAGAGRGAARPSTTPASTTAPVGSGNGSNSASARTRSAAAELPIATALLPSLAAPARARSVDPARSGVSASLTGATSDTASSFLPPAELRNPELSQQPRYRERSPERSFSRGRSPERRSSIARSPERRSSIARSPERRSIARSPERKSPIARSPERRSVGRSPERRRSFARSPDRAVRSPERRSVGRSRSRDHRSPERDVGNSATRNETFGMDPVLADATENAQLRFCVKLLAEQNVRTVSDLRRDI